MTIPRLLVSVRDAAEAEAAVLGGADLIDVKEPANGPLGRADAAVTAAVVRAVARWVPVSAALGELRDCPLVRVTEELPPEVDYVKWGLAGLLPARWGHYLSGAKAFVPPWKAVAVAYADWMAAESPRPADVAAFAGDFNFPAFLLDTYQKDGTTLLDWLPAEQVAALVRRCHAAGVKVALAGSLGPAEIGRLRDVGPDWFAVRGAACSGGRDGRIDTWRVRQLADLVHALPGPP
jgi:uncharacterized protein (UPF0264 family)